MKKILPVIGLGLLLLTGTVAMAADLKVATVNVMDVLQKMPQREAVIKNLEKQFDARGAKLQAEQKTAQANIEKLQKDGMTLSAAQKKKLEDAINDFETKAQAFSDDYHKKENEEFEKLVDKIQLAVKQVADSGKYSVVLKSDAVLYSASSVDDITSKVLQQVSK